MPETFLERKSRHIRERGLPHRAASLVMEMKPAARLQFVMSLLEPRNPVTGELEPPFITKEDARELLNLGAQPQAEITDGDTLPMRGVDG